MRRAVLIAIPYVWLLALFMVPFFIVLKISLSDTALGHYIPLPRADAKRLAATVSDALA